MISFLSQFTFLNAPLRSHSFKPRLCDSRRSCQFSFRRRQQSGFSVLSRSKKKSVIYNQVDQNKPPRTSFPGGYKRTEIKVPNIVLQLKPNDVFSGDVLNRVDEAVAKWVGIIVLDGGEERGGQLYDAACLLKSLIRDRAYLMIAERVDIASAVNASGVVLSDQGLPVIVARNMLMASKPESINLPLVARSVQTSTAALNVSNSEDADFLIYDGAENQHFQDNVNSIVKNVKLPIFVVSAFFTQDFSATSTDNFVKSGINGLVVSLENMELLSDSVLSKLFQTSSKIVKEKPAEPKKPKVIDSHNKFHGEMGAAGFFWLENRDKQLIGTVKSILLESINAIQEAAPLTKDVTLLIDAVSQLDDPFLLAIVGEFNSGKSTVINALLGRRYLKEGVIPTTNEITFLRYAEFAFDEKQHRERYPDAEYTCYLPAPILKEMNIVDTPGTNVILKRQQRLTEEFVPRADLLLFVISADRPLTESEVDFLRYIQQWRKKVVFVLNKSDLYQNNSELEEAISFIKENARNLLNSEHITLFPVSARSALVSKLLTCSDVGHNFDKISTRPDCGACGFDELEMYLYSFLDGSTSAGIERLRLKLETPIGIANKLLCSCETIVRQELYYAKQDLNAVKEIYSTIREFEMKMQSDSITWRRQTLSLIDSTKIRTMKLLESTLQLSNLDLAATLVFKANRSESLPAALNFQNDIIASAVTDVQKLLGEYILWLESVNCHKKNLYKELLEKRWPSSVAQHKPLENQELSKNSLCLKLIQAFSSLTASKLFEQEIREAFSVTFGGLGVAGLSASLLTSVLPTTSEDLLALGLCSSGGYFALLNFSECRQKIIDNFEKFSGSLACELEDAMRKDASRMIEDLERSVEVMSKPFEDAAICRLDTLSKTRDMLSDVQKKLANLQVHIQNLHVS